MKKVSRRIVSVSVGAVMLVVGLLPLIKAYATSYGNGIYSLSFGMDHDNGATLDYMRINEQNWESDGDTFATSNGQYTIDIGYQLSEEDAGRESWLMTSGDLAPYLEEIGGAGDGDRGVIRTYSFDYAQALVDLPAFNRVSLQIGVNRDNAPMPNHEGDTEARLRIRGGEGTFDDSIYDENGNLIEERIVAYADNYIEGSFSINDGWFMQPMPEDAVINTNYSEMLYHYDDDPESDTIMIGFAALWHMRYEDEVIINGTSYNIPINYDDQVSYLSHYGGQMVTFSIEVPKADDNFYDIVVKIGKSEQNWIGNFLWTADPDQQWERDCHDEDGEEVCEYLRDADGNLIPGRDYIGHSSLTLLEVSYKVGNTNYHCSARTDNTFCAIWQDDDEENATYCDPYEEDCETPYLEFDSGNNDYDDGSLVVPAGAIVTMRIVPDYGYQIMNVDMMDLEVDDNGVGEFTFTVPEGAAYFVADVVKTEDSVNSKTSLVVDGSIDLGEGQTTLTYGTARLDVVDVELSDEEKAAFSDAAEDYTVKTYLDISLYNVVCKGGETCNESEGESWNDQVRDLNEPATITLRLEDGVDGNEVVIVHQKHDGTYEIIPTAYDPTTHTITFSTTSFSNYAIASRMAATPETGYLTDEGSTSLSEGKLAFIITVALVSVVTVSGAAVILAKRKNA